MAPVDASHSTPPSPVTTPTPTPAPTTQARPEYIPETHWDSAANKVRDDKALAVHFNEIFARDAAEQSRRLSLPQTPEAYKTELPADFKVPDGINYKFNDADPLLAQARTLAKDLGIPQEGFSKLLGLYAGAQVATQQSVNAARNAEIAKLGATGPARVDALTTFYKAQLGEAEAGQIMSRVLTASDVHLHEKLVARLASQGGATFKGTGREAPEPVGRVSNEQFSKMSAAERLDYARKFPQGQFQTNNGRAA